MSDTCLSVIIPTYNRPDRLRNCLKSLTMQQSVLAAWEVVVVNDGGVDVTKIVNEFSSILNVVYVNQENAGPAKARNHGAENAQSDYLAFLDDDCEPTTDWISNIVSVIKPGILIGGKVVNILKDNVYSESCQSLIDYLYTRLDDTTDMFFTSNNMCISRADFIKTGGFDPSFHTSAGEDREYCVRAAQAGIRLIHVPEISIGHAHHLNLTSFIRLHFKYGRAADTYRKSVHKMEIKNRTNGGSGFYLGMLLYPFRERLHDPFKQSVLLAISQACTISGYLYQHLTGRN